MTDETGDSTWCGISSLNVISMGFMGGAGAALAADVRAHTAYGFFHIPPTLNFPRLIFLNSDNLFPTGPPPSPCTCGCCTSSKKITTFQ